MYIIAGSRLGNILPTPRNGHTQNTSSSPEFNPTNTNNNNYNKVNVKSERRETRSDGKFPRGKAMRNIYGWQQNVYILDTYLHHSRVARVLWGAHHMSLKGGLLQSRRLTSSRIHSNISRAPHPTSPPHISLRSAHRFCLAIKHMRTKSGTAPH